MSTNVYKEIKANCTLPSPTDLPRMITSVQRAVAQLCAPETFNVIT